MSIQKYSVKKGPANLRTRYKVRWLDETTGKHRSEVFLTKADAEAYETSIKTAKFSPGGLGSVKGQMTLAQFVADEWWPYKKAKLSVNTAKTYLTWWNRHIDHPEYGISDRTLQQLVDHPKVIDDFHANLAKVTGPQAQRQTMGLLRNMLGTAVRWKYIPTNPAHGAEVPSAKPAREKITFSPLQVERIRAHIGANDLRPERDRQRDRLMISLLAYSGLRPQELLFLRYEHVQDGHLDIKGAVSWGEEKCTKTGVNRKAPLFDVVRLEIDAYKTACEATETDLIFGTADGKYWPDHAWRNWRTRVFQSACKKVAKAHKDCTGIKDAIPYSCRRSAVSLMLRGGGAQNPARVAKQIGHSLQTMYKHYADEIEGLSESGIIDPEHEILKARAVAA